MKLLQWDGIFTLITADKTGAEPVEAWDEWKSFGFVSYITRG